MSMDSIQFVERGKRRGKSVESGVIWNSGDNCVRKRRGARLPVD